MIQFELPQNNTSIIKIIGVGGGGGNAVNYMHSLGIEGVDFIVCNTDQKALRNSEVPTKIQLGPALTMGLGAGANPEIGRNACEESIGEIDRLLRDNTKMVFVTAGMGGGTGTGAAPIVAKAAKDLGILTVGIVTTPFSYEGRRRMKQAEEGIAELKKCVDTILVISNDKLRQSFGNIPASQAFSRADDILATAAKCITDVINSQGHIVVDFADVTTVMRDGGVAILGSATASGENRAYLAVENAIKSPLLNDSDIRGAKWVLLNINSAHGAHEHTLDEVEMIQAYIQEQAGDECDVIFGTGFDDNLGDKISVTIIATGFTFNSLNEAYNKEQRKPKQEHDKEIYVLGGNSATTANEPEAPAVNNSFEAPVQAEVNDPMAPRMVEVEPIGIPSQMALGMGLGMAFATKPKPVVAEIPTTIERPWDLETPTVAPTPVAQAEPEVSFHFETPVQPEPTPVAPIISEPQEPVFSWELNEVAEASSHVEMEESHTPLSETTLIQEVTEMPQAELESFLTFDMPVAQTPATEENNEAPVYFELSVSDDDNQEVEMNINEVVETIETPETTSSNNIWGMMVEEVELKDDFVTIDGITINRRKGNTYLTDEEIAIQVNFEIQKRKFEERAARLRNMSYDVKNGDINNSEDDTPAYLRRNKPLDETPSSSEDTFSPVQVARQGQKSVLNSLNSFLHGKNPD
ncbi:MAG: cell division protein FtsZ [Chitinophagaceae bacterium]|nr:cell division protein FtsZ [Chitinophagaceae bacterium]